MRRKPTMWESASCIIFMAIVIGVGFGYFKLAVQPLLILSAAYAGFMAYRLGVTWSEMESAISRSLGKAMPAIFIIFAVGIVVGTWVYSGTVPMLIYYGLKIISPQLFLVSAFLIVAIVSTATGTAWGSTATAGVALMGMAQGLGIPLHIAAGAIVAGGVFGDKISPLSDTTNLAPLVTGVDLFDHIKHMFYTTIPSALVGLVVYFIVGMNMDSSATSASTVQGLLTTLDSMYNWNIFLLLPIIIIFVGAIKRMPTVPMMLLASVVAVFVGMFSHGFSFADGVQSMVTGFNVTMLENIGLDPNTIMPDIVDLVNRGGIMSMTSIVVMIFCGYAFAGIVEEAGCLEVILEVIYAKVKNVWQLILVTIVGSIILVVTTGVASIPILMIGSLLTNAYIKMGLHPKNLSRTLEDAGTMLIPFIPWGSSGIFYLEVLGVGPLQFGIWAIPCYLCILFAMIYGVTGIGIAKLSDAQKKDYIKKLAIQDDGSFGMQGSEIHD